MQTVADELELKGRAARKAARELAKLPSAVKDRALLNVADGLKSRQEEVLQANEKAPARSVIVACSRCSSPLSWPPSDGLLKLQLHVVQLRVGSRGLCQQLAVRARLGDAPVFDHEQPVGTLQRRQPVCDGEDGAAGHQPL